MNAIATIKSDLDRMADEIADKRGFVRGSAKWTEVRKFARHQLSEAAHLALRAFSITGDIPSEIQP